MDQCDNDYCNVHRGCTYMQALETKVEILYTTLNDLVAEYLGRSEHLPPSLVLGRAKKALKACAGNESES